MPNTKWSELNHMQLGRYAEYYAKMEFASYGFDVYTSEVDDHGVDFVVKAKDGSFYEIQVKAVRDMNPVLLPKDKWDISSSGLLLALLLFKDGSLPDLYVIPATAWQQEDALLCEKDYAGLKSKPEYELRLSKKNLVLLGKYRIGEMFHIE
jgi:hypothetical protein